MDLQDLPSIETFLRARLQHPLPGTGAHRRFAPRPARDGWRPDDLPLRARRAAALVLLYPGERGAMLPLTLRHTSLPHHPGQVSLPGGRIDLDETAEHAALRETHEEIGVAPGLVRVLGPLSTLWVPVSNHVIHPFIGIAERTPAFQVAPREVDRLVELPFVELRDPARRGWESQTRDDHLVEIPFFDARGHHVWGATAMILGEFVALFEQ